MEADSPRMRVARLAGMLSLLVGLPISAAATDAEAQQPSSPSEGSAVPAGPWRAAPADPEPAWYLPVADGRCELFVQEYGTGPDTVVVLHGGWGAEHGYLLDYFQEAGDEHHLVFYDQRGSLRSPCPDSLVSVDAHVADLERLRRELGLDPVHLAAHSMGTRLALEYLVEHPGRTGGLVLMAPVNPRPFDPARDSALAGDLGARRRAFRERDACEEARREAGVAGPDSVVAERGAIERSRRWRIDFTCANAVHVERWRKMEGGRAYYDASAGRAAAASMDRSFDATSAMAGHGCPVRVIAGADDWVAAGGDVVEHVYAPVSNTEVRVIEDAGHALWLDAPRRFVRALGTELRVATACTQ